MDVDLTYLTRFGSLKELSLTWLTTRQDFAIISKLTQLNVLRLNSFGKFGWHLPFAPSILSNLTSLQLTHSTTGISHLPNLEKLVCSDLGAGLADLPKLRHLEVYNARNQDKILSSLPQFTTLKNLILRLPCVAIDLRLISTLTDLEELHFFFAKSDQDYLYLSNFTKLTRLQAVNTKETATMLHLPTSLQTLHIRSLPNDQHDQNLIEKIKSRLPNLYNSSF